ncbi:hypothetical protein FOL47_009231 [Perkinsus chesapeaki]|uniref:Uncharacterized protein n=1 Tax=Perkinsus chesapeaki TaxID=330153 RepID=A0A7J6MSQ6_PERCH|nr:hypothetical protein FOL47_009231 [Perkinsus chesapeaki]
MGRTSNKDYPLLLSTIFDNFFNGLPPVDNFRDACIGHFNITEICLEGFAVLHARGVAEIEVPILNAGEYHIEAWVGEEEEVSINNSTNVQDNIYFIDKYEGYNTTVKITPSRVEDVVEVGQLEFWLDYSDQVSYWWGNYFGLLHQTQSWMDMFDEAFNAARPLIDEGGQILEFGVAHGRSLLRLAHHARAWNRTVVGFDSFRGLPEAWGPKFNSPGLFDMGGIIPERILKVDNARLNIGLFRDTLPLLDWDIVNTTSFIAFLHIDCDIYSSALEILTTVACLLREGSIVVFDELFNMQGTYTSKEEGRAKTSVSWWEDGEFLALQHSMQLLGLHLKPLKEGIYFEQAVPLIVTKPPTSSTRCDMIRHTMVEAKPSAINTEDYNALLSFKVTAAHILDKWQPDGPHKEDLQKIYLGDDDEVDRKTVESILRHAVVMLDENE